MGEEEVLIAELKGKLQLDFKRSVQCRKNYTGINRILSWAC
jgi:hypothetical protein